MISFFMNREGNLSVFRVGVLIGILGLIAIVAGFLFWNLEHQSRQSPYSPELYPGAEEVRVDEAENFPRQTILYRTQANPDDVAAFYQGLLDDLEGQDPRDPQRQQEHVLCVRLPSVGDFPDYVPGSGNLPYYYRCAFDNSFFESQQVTVVQIEPGVRDDAQGVNNEGTTFIVYDQRWSR
jgi:hypothetical protein